MIPIYDYYGLIVFFREDAKLPITVYGKRAETESKINIHFNEGLMDISNLLPSENNLDEEDKKTFKLLIEQNCSEIIKKWLDYFLYAKPLQVEVIMRKLQD